MATRFKTRSEAEAAIATHTFPSFAAPVWVSPVDSRATGMPVGWYVSVLRELVDFDKRAA